jgi:aldose sugar dehydrogenase
LALLTFFSLLGIQALVLIPAIFTEASTIIDSDQLGENYQYDLFVTDILIMATCHFDLNNNNNTTDNEADNIRDSLLLYGQLSHRIANTTKESNDVLFATGFAGVTDLEVGPDGYLYILTFHKSQGSIHRVVPSI